MKRRESDSRPAANNRWHLLRAVFAFMLMNVMLWSLVPVPALAEMLEETDVQVLSQIEAQSSEEVVPVDEDSVVSEPSISDGELDSMMETQPLAESKPEELATKAAVEVREAAAQRDDLVELDEQTQCVVELFDATTRNLEWRKDEFRLESTDEPSYVALRDLLKSDLTEEHIVDSLHRVLTALGIECVELIDVNHTFWIMVCIGDAWYHVDVVSAVREKDNADSPRAWLLVSDDAITALDVDRTAWNLKDGSSEAPVAENSLDLTSNKEDAEHLEEGDDALETEVPEESGQRSANAGESVGDNPLVESNGEDSENQSRTGQSPKVTAQSQNDQLQLTAQSEAGTRARFLEVVDEQPLGGNKYNKYNNNNGADYCASFVAWCANEAGVSTDVIPRNSAYVTTFRNDLINAGGSWLGWWDTPQPGDLIFYNNINYSDLPGDQVSDDDLNHVGVVVGVDDSRVYTKEGNTNGGQVGTHSYGIGYNGSGSWFVVGYVHPDWPDPTPSGPQTPDWSKFGEDANLPTGYYTIRPVLDTTKYLEIAGGGTGDGDNVQIWRHGWPGECEHIKWHLNRLEDGSYGVDTFAGKVLDVSGGSCDDGANVLQWSWTGVNQQHWYIHDCGNGTYALEAKHSGKFLDLAGGGTDDGTNVQQWSWYSNDNQAQKWVITPCDLYGGKREVDDGWWYIRSAIDPSYALDIANSGGANGDNLQLWDWCRSEKQKFRFVYNGDGDHSYRIETKSGKVLDIDSAKRGAGANIQIYDSCDVDQQRWWIQDVGDWKVAIQSKHSGLYLDVSGGVTENGRNIQQWTKGEGHVAKWWYLVPATEGNVTSVANATYEIVSTLDTSMVATVSNDGELWRTVLGKANGNTKQRFAFSKNDDGSYRLQNVGVGEYLDVPAASLERGVQNTLWSANENMPQKWWIEDTGDGTYSLRNAWTNRYLDVNGGVASQDVALQMWDSNASNSQKFKLRRLTLNDAVIDAIANQTYTGVAVTPNPTVRFAGRTLVRGTDYSVSYSSNIAVGTAMVTVTGLNGFEGSKSATFKISGASLSSATLSEITDRPYTGAAIKPEPTVTLGGRNLVKDTDYTLSWSTNTNVGTATVTATGKNGYTGSKSTTFKIVAAASEPTVFVSPERFVYDGVRKNPAVTVTANGKTLTKDVDYTLSYVGDFTNVGTHSITAALKGNYSGTAQANMQIEPASLDSSTVAAVADQTYTGAAIKPEPKIAHGGRTLIKDTDYTIDWSNNTDTGTATVTMTGKGNYTGTKSIVFKIVPKTITPTVSLSKTKVAYNGSAQRPAVVVKDDSTTLNASQYNVTWSAGCTNVGSYNVDVTLKGNYSGSARASFSIEAANLSDAMIASIGDQTYTGSAINPEPTITLGGHTLIKGTDYTLAWSDNTNVSTATVTATGKGNYTGSKSLSFNIVRARVAIPVTKNFTYNGKVQEGVSPDSGYSISGTAKAIMAGSYTVTATPDANHMWPDGTTTTKTLSWDIARKKVMVHADDVAKTAGATDPKLTATVLGLVGSDQVNYDLARETGEEIGTYEIIATGDPLQGNYEVAFYGGTFTIAQGVLNDATLDGLPAEVVYDGGAKTPTFTVTLNGVTLQSDVDYQAEYYENIDVGIATVVIVGKGNYAGTKTATFRIIAKRVKPSIELSQSMFTYNGQVQRPTITLRDDGKVIDDWCYEVAWKTDCRSAGAHRIELTLAGNYAGTESIWYSIEPQSIAGSSLSGVTNRTYTGVAQTQKPSIKLGQMTLREGVDYTLSYKNNVNPGIASMTIMGRGNYTGSVVGEFTIDKATSSITITAQTKTYNGKAQAYSGKVTKSGSTGKVTYAYYSDAACTKAIDVANIKNVGTYYVRATLAADANYAGATSGAVEFSIVKAGETAPTTANPMKVKTKKKTVKFIKLRKKAQSVKPVVVTGAQGTVTYKVTKWTVKKAKKYFKVDKSTGKVTVKKGTPKGSYKFKVKVIAAGNATYKSGSKTVTVTVNVK